MKKSILLTFALCTILLSGYSQIEKNTFLLGAYSNLYLNTNDNSYFSINPNSGIFLSDHFCLGLSFPIVHNKNISSFGLAPFARYYLTAKESQSLFFSAALGITTFIESANGLDDNAIELGVGYVWMLNKSIGFEPELIVGSDFVDISMELQFGFQVYFNRKNK